MAKNKIIGMKIIAEGDCEFFDGRDNLTKHVQVINVSRKNGADSMMLRVKYAGDNDAYWFRRGQQVTMLESEPGYGEEYANFEEEFKARVPKEKQ